MGRLRKLGRLAVVDTTPLRQVSGYRWLFAAMFAMQVGRQLTVVAVPLQIYDMTGSTLAVGLLGLAQLIPLLLVSLIGGALADAIDRRRLLAFSQMVMAFTAAGLLWNSLADSPALWPLYVLGAFNAGISAIVSPARTALLPGLVGRALLPSALALNQTQTNIAKAAVPALGGFLIAVSGFPVTYALETLALIVSVLLVFKVPNVETEGGGRPFSLSSIMEGFQFLRPRRLIQAALLIDLAAMVFGMPTALFPAFGKDVLGGNDFTVGLLFAAPGIGALIGALTSGWVPLVRRQGRAVVVAVIGWGFAIAIFGLSSTLVVSLLALAVAGAADVVSAIFRGSIVQLSVPDSLRGRLSSMHMAVVAGGPRLGDLEAGVVAALTSVRFSIVSGGLACVLAAWGIARWAPSFLNYEYDPDEPEVAAPANP